MLFLNNFAAKRAHLRAWTLSTEEVICRYHGKRWSKDFVKMCFMIRTVSENVDEIRNNNNRCGWRQAPSPPPPSPFTLWSPECEILSTYNIHDKIWYLCSMFRYTNYIRSIIYWLRRVLALGELCILGWKQLQIHFGMNLATIVADYFVHV